MRYFTGFVLASLLAACAGPTYQPGSEGGERDPTVLQKRTCKNIFDTVDLVDGIIKALDRPGDEKERKKWCETRKDLEDAYIKANCTDLMLPAPPAACFAL